MAIKTSTFGGWRLSGEDAKFFRDYMEKHASKAPHNPQAIKTMQAGRGMAAELVKTGHVRTKRLFNIVDDET